MMLENKEQLFQEYFETTKKAVASLDPEEVASLVEFRDTLITQINQCDKKSGKPEMNANMKELIIKIQELDIELNVKLKQLKVEAQDKIQSYKNAQRLKNQYDPTYALTDGAFYDKRR